MICVPVMASTRETMLTQMNEAANDADILELRLDHFPTATKADVESLVRARPKPIIATNRPRRQGGRCTLPEARRLETLMWAAKAGAEYADLEYDCASKELVESLLPSKAIISYHDFDTTPKDLGKIISKIPALRGTIRKVATMANDITDSIRMLKEIKRARGDLIGICMGERGEITRIVGPLVGSPITYGSSGQGNESAPGQIPARIMNEVYGVNTLRKETKIYGLIGNPVAKSKGYLVHNEAFRAAKYNAVYVNLLVDRLGPFLDEATPMIEGFSVTMPFKEQIMEHLDQMDGDARKIGAVNTVVKKNGKLAGSNTDGAGALRALEKHTTVNGKRALVLGAGGSARAIVHALMKAGARVTIANRTEAKGRALAVEFGCESIGPKEISSSQQDIVINTTSVGMDPHLDESPAPRSFLKDMVVFDIIYSPPITKLLNDARANGCTIVTGEEMFLAQAALQSKLWTGKEPNMDAMEEALKRGIEA